MKWASCVQIVALQAQVAHFWLAPKMLQINSSLTLICPQGEAKFWIEPRLELAKNQGISERELRIIENILDSMLLWHKFLYLKILHYLIVFVVSRENRKAICDCRSSN